MQPDNKIYLELHANLCDHLPTWLGKEFMQIPPSLNFQKREFSYTSLSPIMLEDGQEIIIRIKIPRLPNTPSIKYSMTDELLREYGLREYTTLQEMYAVVSKESNPNLCAIQVLGYLSEFNAIIMIELKSRNLEEMMFDLRMRLGSKKLRKRFENAMIETGRLLRLYHDYIGHSELENFDGEPLFERVDNSIEKLKYSLGVFTVESLNKKFAHVIRNLDKKLISVASLHRDFAFKNIVITPDDCVAVLDMDVRISRERRHIYLDLARLITDIVVQKVKVQSLGFLLPKRTLKKYETLFLDGYFLQAPIERECLALYKTIGMLDALKWYETKTQAARGFSRIFAKFIYPTIQSYLIANAQQFLDEVIVET